MKVNSDEETRDPRCCAHGMVHVSNVNGQPEFWVGYSSYAVVNFAFG